MKRIKKFMQRIGFDMNYTISNIQLATGGIGAAISAFFAPIHTMIILVFVFVGIDFITGVWASYVRAKRAGKLNEWGFESSKAWNTVAKLVFIMVGIVMAWLIQTHFLNVLGAHIKLEYLFSGFVCGTEFWSYLENAAEISQHPVFKWLKRFMKKKVADAMSINEIIKDDENTDNT